jgi:hypothetical protein
MQTCCSDLQCQVAHKLLFVGYSYRLLTLHLCGNIGLQTKLTTLSIQVPVFYNVACANERSSPGRESSSSEDAFSHSTVVTVDAADRTFGGFKQGKDPGGGSTILLVLVDIATDEGEDPNALRWQKGATRSFSSVFARLGERLHFALTDLLNKPRPCCSTTSQHLGVR